VIRKIVKLIGKSIAGIALPSNIAWEVIMLYWLVVESVRQSIAGTVLPVMRLRRSLSSLESLLLGLFGRLRLFEKL
jgi:hypothetical protein